MINESIFIKEPFKFKHLCKIYPPSVRDILQLENMFGPIRKILTMSQEEIEDTLVDKVDEKGQPVKLYSPWEYLFINAKENAQIGDIIRLAFYFFIHESVLLLHDRKEIVIGDISAVKKMDELRILTEADYFEFQNLVRLVLGDPQVEPPRPDEDPRVKRIKAKARLRDRIKAEKGLGISLETTLASVCCMGLGITPLNIGELAYGSLGTLVKHYQAKEKYETDIASLMAGADSKKIKPKYWIRNLND